MNRRPQRHRPPPTGKGAKHVPTGRCPRITQLTTPLPHLQMEDRVRLVWVSAQLSSDPTELISLATTWLVRQLHSMVSHGVFTPADLGLWRESYPFVAATWNHTHNCFGKGSFPNTNPPGLCNLGCYVWKGDPDVHGRARAFLADLYGMPGESIPDWAIRLVLYGSNDPLKVASKRMAI